jgi:DNA-binding LacI/PurR family transcriptional regulator
VGYDDIALTDYTVPPLTTVAQDKYAMGSRAVHMVARILAGEAVTGTTRLPVRLVIRGSTAPPRSTLAPGAATAGSAG